MTVTTEALHMGGRVVRMVRIDDGTRTRYLTVPEAVKLAAGLYACVDAALKPC
jgi:hypothetical protein